jgi:hypothetical protein
VTALALPISRSLLMPWADLFAMFWVVIGQFALLPLLGAGLLFLAARLIGVPAQLTFLQSWKATSRSALA